MFKGYNGIFERRIRSKTLNNGANSDIYEILAFYQNHDLISYHI